MTSRKRMGVFLSGLWGLKTENVKKLLFLKYDLRICYYHEYHDIDLNCGFESNEVISKSESKHFKSLLLANLYLYLIVIIELR